MEGEDLISHHYSQGALTTLAEESTRNLSYDGGIQSTKDLMTVEQAVYERLERASRIRGASVLLLIISSGFLNGKNIKFPTETTDVWESLVIYAPK